MTACPRGDEDDGDRHDAQHDERRDGLAQEVLGRATSGHRAGAAPNATGQGQRSVENEASQHERHRRGPAANQYDVQVEVQAGRHSRANHEEQHPVAAG